MIAGRTIRIGALIATVVVGSLGLRSVGASDERTTTRSRCSRGRFMLVCEHETRSFEARGVDRTVYFQVPVGAPPAKGWPVVIVFQPAIYRAESHWTGLTGFMGQRHSTEGIATLLDAGYAVLMPRVESIGGNVWDTNLPTRSDDWTSTADHALVLALFDRIEAGDFGKLDSSNLFATGMSSGGYMTSRMGLAYPEKFRALAIQSAAWATCAGFLDTAPPSFACDAPRDVSREHPPTLFVHGTSDPVVPIDTMRRYYDRLVARGVPAKKIEVPGGMHAFFSVSAGEILAWFERHRR